jgi:hypothetical protein
MNFPMRHVFLDGDFAINLNRNGLKSQLSYGDFAGKADINISSSRAIAQGILPYIIKIIALNAVVNW